VAKRDAIFKMASGKLALNNKEIFDAGVNSSSQSSCSDEEAPTTSGVKRMTLKVRRRQRVLIEMYDNCRVTKPCLNLSCRPPARPLCHHRL
jgi:hypothetical protein